MESGLQQNAQEVRFEVKRGHKDQVISSCCFRDVNSQRSPYLFLTNSEDGEIRLWDVRQSKSAKLFKMPESPNEGRRARAGRLISGTNFANVQMDAVNGKVLSSVDNSLVVFDFVQEKVLNLPQSVHSCANDMISWLKTDAVSQHAYFCDEAGGVGGFDYKGRLEPE